MLHRFLGPEKDRFLLRLEGRLIKKGMFFTAQWSWNIKLQVRKESKRKRRFFVGGFAFQIYETSDKHYFGNHKMFSFSIESLEQIKYVHFCHSHGHQFLINKMLRKRYVLRSIDRWGKPSRVDWERKTKKCDTVCFSSIIYWALDEAKLPTKSSKQVKRDDQILQEQPKCYKKSYANVAITPWKRYWTLHFPW